MNETKKLISYFNRLQDGYEFTSKSVRAGLRSKGVNKTTISNTLNKFYKMGAVEKEKIENPGRGPRLKYAKIRSITTQEKHDLTTWPDCIAFTKKLNAQNKKATTPTPTKPTPVKKKKVARKKVKVKGHTRLIKTKNTRVTVVEKDDRTIITVFK